MSRSDAETVRFNRALARGGTYLAFVLITLQAVMPFVWMLFGSFKTLPEFYTSAWSIPEGLVWENYPAAWTGGQVGEFLWNSVLVVTGGVVVLLLTSVPFAYAIARIDFPGRRVLFWMVVATIMIPPDIIIVPLFLVVRDIGLMGYQLTLSLVYASGGFAISVFLLRAYFLAIPKELEESAVVDGAGVIRVMLMVAVPLAIPGVLTVTVLQAMSMWNDLFMALVFLRSEAHATVPLGLLNFFQRFSIDWPLFLAGLVITTVPIVLVYAIAQRWFIQGLSAGAVKG